MIYLDLVYAAALRLFACIIMCFYRVAMNISLKIRIALDLTGETAPSVAIIRARYLAT